jgi:outer membrane protein TolC
VKKLSKFFIITGGLLFITLTVLTLEIKLFPNHCIVFAAEKVYEGNTLFDFVVDTPKKPKQIEPKPVVKERPQIVKSPALADYKELMLANPNISLKDYVKLVQNRNQGLTYHELEWTISKEAVKEAESIFEPEMSFAYNHDYTHVKNSVSDIMKMFGSPEESEDSKNEYNAAVSNLLPTGATITVGYAMAEEIDELFEPSETDTDDRDFRTILKAEIEQPLLKNAGFKATKARINIAKAQEKIAFQSRRKSMMKIISDAANAYWDMFQAQKIYEMRKKAINISRKLLKDNKERVRLGKMAQTEVMEAEAGVALRKSLAAAAKQNWITAVNNANSLIFSATANSNIKIIAADSPSIKNKKELDYHKSLNMALESNPDYLSSKIKKELEQIRIDYLKNQCKYKLDFLASYGVDGLNDSANSSFEDATSTDYKTWNAGLRLQIPMFGGKKNRSELSAATHRKNQSVIAIRNNEINIANQIDSSINHVYHAEEQVKNYKKISLLKKDLLDEEYILLKMGKSTSKNILERDEELNEAKEVEVKSLVYYMKAVAGLKVAEGSILKDYRLEIFDEKK